MLLLLGGGVAYVTTRAALTRQFDDALRTKALALTTITEQDHGEIKLEVADLFMREFDADVSTAFYQLWRGDGAVVDRSPSLRGANLPRRGGTLGAPEFWNLDGPGNAKHTSQSVLGSQATTPGLSQPRPTGSTRRSTCSPLNCSPPRSTSSSALLFRRKHTAPATPAALAACW
ncbi:MAG: sensor histidine kinase N-terminal domain-containing protein [Verrucomicrobia bacterium]|nr:sensor histidine kinase N-terminal domain-containing protein [Verrucomicrobiota bacterium]